MLFKDNSVENIYGYISLYFKLEGEKETHYASCNMDFENPLSKKDIINTANTFKKHFEQVDTIHKIEMITKEEFDAYSKENKMDRLNKDAEHGWYIPQIK